jgi:glycine cleavage system H protein
MCSDVVFVDLPSVGAKYAAGESFGSVESVKAASEVYVPVAGEVVAINSVCTRFW